jgi:hypothetical protein
MNAIIRTATVRRDILDLRNAHARSSRRPAPFRRQEIRVADGHRDPALPANP